MTVSGYRTVTRAFAISPKSFSPPFSEVLRISDTKQDARVLRVSTRAIVQGLSEDEQRAMARTIGGAGIYWNRENGLPSPWLGGAALRITTGSTPGMPRTIFADLREGEYVLPPCTDVGVSVAYWKTNANADNSIGDSPLEVTLEVADGTLADPTPLQVSAQRFIPWFGEDVTGDTGGAGVKRCAIPPGAYAWDAFADGVSTLRAKCGPLTAARDPDGTKWAPPFFPLPLVGSSDLQVGLWTLDEAPTPIIEGQPGWDTQAQEWTACVVFYVR